MQDPLAQSWVHDAPEAQSTVQLPAEHCSVQVDPESHEAEHVSAAVHANVQVDPDGQVQSCVEVQVSVTVPPLLLLPELLLAALVLLPELVLAALVLLPELLLPPPPETRAAANEQVVPDVVHVPAKVWPFTTPLQAPCAPVPDSPV